MFESFCRNLFGPRPSMGDNGGRREKTGDGAALCQGDEHNGGSKRVFVPCTDPTCKGAELQVSRPAPHFSCIAPSLNPPSTHNLTLPTHHLIHPASVPAVARHQCGQPRSPKYSEATSGLRGFVGFGLVKITVLSHGQESFPGLVWAWRNVLQPTRSPHGQSLVLLSHG